MDAREFWFWIQPVSLADNPLRRGVHPCPLVLELVLLHQEAARAKVYEEDLVGVQVDHQVLILHVLVHHPPLMAGCHHVQHLQVAIIYEQQRKFCIEEQTTDG